MYQSPFKQPCRVTGSRFKQSGTMWSCGCHTGEDWYCDNDRTLASPANGTIQRAVTLDKSYGNFVIITTDDGKSILMAHMAQPPCVSKGQRVSAGQAVGVMGTTGNSTGVHLHIEIENASTWAYNRNLLKPSDYIDFNNYATEKGDFEMAKTWTNGSTTELVYADSAKKSKIGSLDPRETCDCLGTVDGMYIVRYNVTGTNSHKVGLVEYNGGVQ